MKQINKFTMTILSFSSNEYFARAAVAAFLTQLDPTIEELNDVKTAVSEAVTNAVVHGYPDAVGDIELNAVIDSDSIHIEIIDNGVGIECLEKALEPFYSTKPETERSGMGFSIMQSFMDEIDVKSSLNNGTIIKMSKKIKQNTAV